MKKIIVGIFAISLALFSCTKKDSKNSIEIINPEAGKEYTSPLPLKIKVSNAKHSIHDLEVKVFKKDEPELEIFEYDNHIHHQEFELIDTLFVNVSVPTVFVLDIETGEEIEVNKRIEFTIKP